MTIFEDSPFRTEDFRPGADTRLVVDGEQFHSTGYKGEGLAKAVAERVHGKVKPFGVTVLQINPATGDVLRWEKSEGYSVWQ